MITDEVEAAIDELSALAPLHNPANLLGIRAAQLAFPTVETSTDQPVDQPADEAKE